MTNRLLALLCAGVLALAVAGCSSSPSIPTPLLLRDETPTEGLITVTGKAGITAAPDIVTITLGVEARGSSSEATRSKCSSDINSTVAAVKAAGVVDADISTSNLSLWPTTDDYGSVTGYRMSTDLRVVVRDIDKAGAVIDSAIASGSNNLGNVTYSFSKEDELYRQALTNAVAAAREKAELLAAAANKSVVEVRSITESAKGATLRANPDTGGGSKYQSADTALLAGSSTISSEVTVVFVIA